MDYGVEMKGDIRIKEICVNGDGISLGDEK